MVLSVDFNSNLIFARRIQTPQQRLLQASNLPITPSSAPSMLDFPSSSPTYFDSGINSLLYVSGIYNGYSNDVLVTDQASNDAGRCLLSRHIQEETDPQQETPPIEATDPQQETSNCFCPIDAIRAESPSAQLLTETLQEVIQASIQISWTKPVHGT